MHRFTRRQLIRRHQVGLAVGALLVGLLATSAAAVSARTPAAPQAWQPTTGRSQQPAAVDNWPTYHYSQDREGYDPNIPAASAHLSTAWTANLDGAVYAEPLVVSDTIIAVTENDSIYGLSLHGKVLWKRHIGTPVPRSELPCGDIDPLGITGTPIYNPVTGEIYFAAELDHPIRHRLYAITASTGRVAWSRSIDTSGLVPSATQERGALAITRGHVWVPFGGLYGDCGPYHGWVIGSLVTGAGALSVYQQPSSREAGIWAPSGPAIDHNGYMYVAIGNGAATSPPYDDSDSVMKLDGNKKLSLFAPTDWAHENAEDLDLGSTGPVLFSALGRYWAYGDGKAGDGYLLHEAGLGGIGGSAASVHDCASWSGMAFHSGVIFVPCSSGLSAYRVVPGPALHKVWTNTDAGYGASPVIGGGAVWAVSDGLLLEINQTTGKTVTSIGVGVTPHFVTPTLHGTYAYVGTMSGVTAFRTS